MDANKANLCSFFAVVLSVVYINVDDVFVVFTPLDFMPFLLCLVFGTSVDPVLERDLGKLVVAIIVGRCFLVFCVEIGLNTAGLVSVTGDCTCIALVVGG